MGVSSTTKIARTAHGDRSQNNRVRADTVKSLIVALSLTLLAACANPKQAGRTVYGGYAVTEAYEVTLPDGTDVWHVECPGPGNTWGACLRRGGDLCPSGFILLDKTTDGVASTSGGAVVTKNGAYATANSSVERVAIIKCKTNAK